MLCYLVSAPKSQDFPHDSGSLRTKLRRQQNGGLRINLISVSCVGAAAGIAWMKQLYLSPGATASGSKFLLRSALSPQKLSGPQHDADGKRDFIEPK